MKRQVRTRRKREGAIRAENLGSRVTRWGAVDAGLAASRLATEETVERIASFFAIDGSGDSDYQRLCTLIATIANHGEWPAWLMNTCMQREQYGITFEC